jgi:aryl-alcohol dehydrogenase-like predicted oxidoreductase
MDSIKNDLVKKIALGTVQFGLHYGISNTKGKTTLSEVSSILKEATRFGIDLVDTAYSYGESEKVLGNFLQDFDFKIVTKFPRPQQGDSIRNYFEESISCLRVQNLHGYMAHDGASILDNPKLWEELIELRENGRVSKVGYSLYSPSELRQLTNMHGVPDIIQVPYNVFDRRFEPEFERLKSEGTEIHVRSSFLQGLFFVNPDSLPAYFDAAKPLLKKMREITEDDHTLAGSLLMFCLSNPFIDRVIIGVNNTAQLVSNIERLFRPLPPVCFDDFYFSDESILLPYKWPKISL